MNQTDVYVKTMKEIVTLDFQTAAVFEKYSLDFCCHGGRTIEQACSEKGIDSSSVVNELMHLDAGLPGESSRFAEWPVEFLIKYIINNHHAYVTKMIPVLLTHTHKVASVHGAHHPEVVRIADLFENVAAELQHHMQKEEQILFPYIQQLGDAKEGRRIIEHSPFGSVKNPIQMMEREHQAAGDELYEIRSLSSLYTPPADACTTFRVTYQELREFEKDLHQHVHLENNILFPKAILLEQELIARN